MRMNLVAAVIGARPQFVKAAALEKAYRSGSFKKEFKILWIHTGQHYDAGLSGVFFKEFCLPAPRYNLGVGSTTHGVQTALMLERLERVFLRERPDLLLVFGDTNSTLAGALAAAKMGIPVAHVEAGLRSFDRALPEETNRVVTDRLSTLLFCPLRSAKAQLAREGIRRRVYVVGDVMADILLDYKKRLCEPKRPERYYLATIHRNTNTDDPKRLMRILKSLAKLGQPVVMPLHPRTEKLIGADRRLKDFLAATASIRTMGPVPYGRMLNLQKLADGVITDSGGIQKEAFLLGTPCVTLRKETEWKETVECGRNVLCEPDARTILRAFSRMRKRKIARGVSTVYGRGNASEKILRLVSSYLKKRKREKK